MHPTVHEPTPNVHCIVIDKQDNTRYMHGSLPSNNCSVLYHIYIASLINCIQPDDGHSSIGRNMQLISYINLIIELCHECYIIMKLLP